MRFICSFFVVLSMVFSAIPQNSYAAVNKCPMAAKMNMENGDNSKPCANCPKMTQQQKSKGNCCGNDKCSSQCSTVNISSAGLSNDDSTSYLPTTTGKITFFSTGVLTSSFLNSQERPPKHLS